MNKNEKIPGTSMETSCPAASDGLTDELIDRIAGLAELSVSEASRPASPDLTSRSADGKSALPNGLPSDGDRERIRSDMEQMLGFVNQLRDADVDGIDLSSEEGAPTVFREDEAVVSETPEELVSGAPGITDGMFAVPRSI